MPERLPFFATAARGTEPLLAAELQELGAARVRQDRGGVRFAANWTEALHICLWTRIAMRALYSLGEFEAQGTSGLYQAVASLPWEEHLTSSSTFAVEATLRGSEQSHSGFVALKAKDAIADRLRQKLGARPNVNAKNPDLRILVHLSGERLSVGLDLAGDALHRRGYRVAPTEAPLKETLAAAMLRASGYSGEESLLDPMCGSGTLLIEAAMIAIQRPPGLGRSFGVERWPHQGGRARQILDDLRSEAVRGERKAPFPILGFDREAPALEAARRNVAAAKLGAQIRLQRADATEPLQLQSTSPGLLITNPPYGNRLRGSQRTMKSFYFKLGNNLQQLRGWRLFVLAGNPSFESAFHRKPASTRTLWNGPIECRLLSYPPS